MNAKETLTKIYRLIFPKKQKKKFSIIDEAKDWAISIVIAAVAYFIILPAIFGSTSPLVVVSSCSEKGFIDIGDILFIQGVKISDVNAPLIELSEFTGVSLIIEKNETRFLNISGQIVELNRSNDIVVYNANPSGAQIIHRVFAKIKYNGEYYLITKGDANQLPDQFGVIEQNGRQSLYPCMTENPAASGRTTCLSTLITQQMLVGKRILVNVPLLGHVKLFFCDLIRLCDGHSNPGTNYEYQITCG